MPENKQQPETPLTDINEALETVWPSLWASCVEANKEEFYRRAGRLWMEYKRAYDARIALSKNWDRVLFPMHGSLRCLPNNTDDAAQALNALSQLLPLGGIPGLMAAIEASEHLR